MALALTLAKYSSQPTGRHALGQQSSPDAAVTVVEIELSELSFEGAAALEESAVG